MKHALITNSVHGKRLSAHISSGPYPTLIILLHTHTSQSKSHTETNALLYRRSWAAAAAVGGGDNCGALDYIIQSMASYQKPNSSSKQPCDWS